jgi:hypothetical protein
MAGLEMKWRRKAACACEKKSKVSIENRRRNQLMAAMGISIGVAAKISAPA